MLVLSRHVDQSIVINGNITVTVIGIFGDKVRLGVTAPKEVPCHREEVHREIQREIRDGTRRPAETYRCPRCEHLTPWADGTESDVWCHACGHEFKADGHLVRAASPAATKEEG